MKSLLKCKSLAVLLALLLAAWGLPVYAEDTGESELTPPPESSVETPSEQPEQPPEETEIPDDEVPTESTPEETDPIDEGDIPAEPEETPEEDPEPGRLLKAAQEINVQVPAHGQMIINPYGLPVESEGMETTAQIVNPVQQLTNTGSQPVLVDVRVVGSVPEGSEAVLVDREPAPDVKEVFLYAEFQNDPDGWLDGYKAGYNQVPAIPEGTDGEGVLTLEAEQTGYFRIFGEMSTEPLWEKTDTFDVSLAFSFTVIGEEEPQAEMPKDQPAPEETPPGDTPAEPSEDPETPEQPEEPVEPTEPTDPTEPVDPVEPTEPTKPVDPAEPTDPTDPVDPTEPTEPTDPVDPTEPTEPTDLVDPTESTDPTEPTEPEPSADPSDT